MQIDNMPINLTLSLFGICKGCDQFDTEDGTFYIGKTEYHTITCSHRDACARLINKLEGIKNDQR